MDFKSFRVSVRVTNGRELEDALRILRFHDPQSEVNVYDGLVTGLVTRPILGELLAAGLMVDRSSSTPDDPLPKELPGVDASPAISGYPGLLEQIRAVAKQFTSRASGFLSLAADSGASGEPEKAVYNVQLTGPMRPAWGRFLEDHGLRVLSYAPPCKYRMELGTEQKSLLSQQSFVASVEPYDLRETVTPEFLEKISQARESGSNAPVTFDLMVHAPDQAEEIWRTINDADGRVESVSGRYIRFQASPLSPLVANLAARTEVKSITAYTPPEMTCDYGRTLIGIPAVNQAAGGPWDGAGQIVAVFDSGIDQHHPDLCSRIQSYQTVPGATATDQFGHGTHVAGTIAGDGTASHGQIRGVAPVARLAIIGICDAQNLPLLPADMGELLQLALNEGAFIINLSLGFKLGNIYDQYAESLDEFVFKNPNVLVVIAGGNSGSAHSGWPDFSSIGTPATAKNAITVGACVTNRNGFTNTWNAFNGAAFPAPPSGARLLTGPPLLPAALSSRGPTDYYTFKPDVLAPGTYVLSAQASGGTLTSYAPVPPGTGPYIFLNGSSMATPFVSGSAAVIRHYLASVMNTHEPSAALLKALLCCSAVRCDSVMKSTTESKVGYPDFDQGVGRIDLSTILPHQDQQSLRLAFKDIANDSPEALQSRVPANSGRRANRVYTVTVKNNGYPLRVLLAWTDAPGRFLQNTLQLDVQGPNVHLVGNHEHLYMKDSLFQEAGLPGIPFDRNNNVQVVNLKNAAAGQYTVNVLAQNTADPAHYQGYALCVTGSLDSDLTEEAPAF